MRSSTGRPPRPPDLLMRSTAICTPTSAVLPPAAAVPESGWSVPTLKALACPNASRHHAGTVTVAPSAPAAAAPKPRKRRRVVLPLYQKSSAWAHFSSVHFSAMAKALLGPLRSLLGDGLEGRGEHLDGPLDVFFSVSEGDIDLLSRLDDTALEQLAGEGGVQGPVGGERGPVVGDGTVGEVDLEDRCLPGDLRLETRAFRRLAERRLHPVCPSQRAARRRRACAARRAWPALRRPRPDCR